MRKFKPFTLIILLLVITPLLAQETVMNIGHRGTGTNAPGNDFPENTIPSFVHAFLEGADMVELDVLLTSDDQVIVIHDATLDRTTDCTGPVIDITLSEIKQCDAAWGTPLQGTGVEVPTLAEVFDAVDGPINVEIKSDHVGGTYTAAHIAERVLTVIADAGAAARVVISSFSLDVCAAVKTLAPALPVAYLTSELNVNAEIDKVIAAGLDGIHPYGLQTFAANVTYAHDNGLFVNVWTIDPAALMQTMITRGVDGVITNEPDVLAEVLADDDTVDDDTVDDDTSDDDTTDDDTVDDDTLDDDTADDDTTDDDAVDDDAIDDDAVDDDAADDDTTDDDAAPDGDDDDDDDDSGCGS